MNLFKTASPAIALSIASALFAVMTPASALARTLATCQNPQDSAPGIGSLSAAQVIASSYLGASSQLGPELLPEMKPLLLERINAARAEEGLGPLTSDPRLEKAAENYAVQMCAQRTIEHELRPDPALDVNHNGTTDYEDYLLKEGYRYSRIAQNNALAFTYSENTDLVGTADALMNGRKTRQEIKDPSGHVVAIRNVTEQGWLESPGHLENIMTPSLEQIGVGCTKCNLRNAEGKLDPVSPDDHFSGTPSDTVIFCNTLFGTPQLKMTVKQLAPKPRH